MTTELTDPMAPTRRDALFVRAMDEGPEAANARAMLIADLTRDGLHPSQMRLIAEGGRPATARHAYVEGLKAQIADLRAEVAARDELLAKIAGMAAKKPKPKAR